MLTGQGPHVIIFFESMNLNIFVDFDAAKSFFSGPVLKFQVQGCKDKLSMFSFRMAESLFNVFFESDSPLMNNKYERIIS